LTPEKVKCLDEKELEMLRSCWRRKKYTLMQLRYLKFIFKKLSIDSPLEKQIIMVREDFSSVLKKSDENSVVF
jgi:hypothetical protein